MSEWQLSKRADGDLTKIYLDSLISFGVRQADLYVREMKKRFQLLADYPQIGRRYDFSRSDLRRFEYESHVIFYRHLTSGIRIQRVLHRSMDPIRHL